MLAVLTARWWVILCACTLAAAAPQDSLLRILQLSERELLVLTSAQSMRVTEDLNTPPNQIKLEIVGVCPTAATQEVQLPSSACFTTVYARYRPAGTLLIIERQPRYGYVYCVLPYSRALYLRAVDWNVPAEQQLALGIDAWQREQYRHAIRYWTAALSYGSTDAALWLGIAEALQQHYDRALDYLRPYEERERALPDLYAALATIYAARGDEQQASRFRIRFEQAVGRRLESMPPALKDLTTSSPLPSITELLQPHVDSAASPQTSAVKPKVSDTADIFAQLRALQGRTADTSRTTESSSNSTSWLWTALLGVGAGLLLSGIVLLRGYYRWRAARIAQAAAATPSISSPAIFERLIDDVLASTQAPANQHSSEASDMRDAVHPSAEQSAEPQQPAASKKLAVDEELLYHSPASPQVSIEAADELELSEQERELLELLARLKNSEQETKRIL